MAYDPAIASCWFDISARRMDLAKVSRLLRLRPTHWYSPRKVEPRGFKFARVTAFPRHRYCWQVRTRLLASNLPSAGLDRIVMRLSGREEAIRQIRKESRADVMLGVYVYSNDDMDPSVWVSAKAVRFAAAIGAHLEVSLMRPRADPPRKVAKAPARVAPRRSQR